MPITEIKMPKEITTLEQFDAPDNKYQTKQI